MRPPHARIWERARFWGPREVAGACLAAAAGLAASPARATTTLTVDLSIPIGPVSHAVNGSLYGVIEQKPADLANLLAPLHPNMFNNPAVAGSGYQQPVGDAIGVAGRVAPYGAKVTIRFADWFPGWYSFDGNEGSCHSRAHGLDEPHHGCHGH